MHSIPRYYTDMLCYELETIIESVEARDGLTIVTLEDTIFHPQGGGQPADQGVLQTATGLMEVTHVKRKENGQIEHIGTMIEGTLQPGARVACTVDQTKRQLYSRLHSAGHLLDVALSKLGLNWEPGKGYHFADGPYVEYHTSDSPSADLAEQLERMIKELISQDIPTRVELQGTTRIVTLGEKPVPCGGTHVQSLGELGELKIRSIKQKGGTIKIGYTLTP